MQPIKVFFCQFLPSSFLPGWMENLKKIHVDRPSISLYIWIKIMIFPQILVNTDFFVSLKKNVFSIFWEGRGEDGMEEISLGLKFFHIYSVMFCKKFENLRSRTFMAGYLSKWIFTFFFIYLLKFFCEIIRMFPFPSSI